VNVTDIYSKRQKALQGEIPDVYTYSDLPAALRTQIVHIWRDAIDGAMGDNTENAYQIVCDILCREYGRFTLGDRGHRHIYANELTQFFLRAPTEEALDVVELVFRFIDRNTRNFEYAYRQNFDRIADACIRELNYRFRESAVGFRFEHGGIVRIDSELLHSEVVKPALVMLSDPIYVGSQQEFLSAFDHYRHRRNKEALNDCLKAFESGMKSICQKRGWAYQPNDTAKALIKVCFDNGLIPRFWEQHLAALRSSLESAVPVGRNKLGGHGQGAQKVEVPDGLTGYMLHMTAATLLFLTKAEEALP
jgi:hypothetical protein